MTATIEEELKCIQEIEPSDWSSKQYFWDTLEYVKEPWIWRGKETNDGLWLEFGVGRGNSINTLSLRDPKKMLYGFDSFDGLPEDWGPEEPKGTYSLAGYPPSVNENVKLFKGLFQDTLEDFLKEHGEPVAFLHMDADLYSSTIYVLRTLRADNRFGPGTVISFDEVWGREQYEQHELKAWVDFVNRSGENHGMMPIKYKWITRTYRGQASLIIVK